MLLGLAPLLLAAAHNSRSRTQVQWCWFTWCCLIATVQPWMRFRCLNKPYLDGGYENSSRVFGARGFDMLPRLRAAVYAPGLDPAPAPVPELASAFGRGPSLTLGGNLDARSAQARHLGENHGDPTG